MANTLKFGNGEWYGKKDTILAYNDENYNYKPLPFNFSRDSSATVVNKDGLIETVGSGEPRIDYKDDSKGALLLEPSRTNLFPYSEDFSDASWSKQNVSLTSNYELSPSGNLTADRVITTNTGVDLYQDISVVENTSYQLTFYAKLRDGEDIQARFYDLSNSSNISYVNYSSQLSDNEWKRVEIEVTTPLGCTSLRVWLVALTSTVIDVSYWGAQLEEGSYATSYIPTQGSIVTRNQDVCSQTVPSGVIGQTEGTLFVEYSNVNFNGTSYLQSLDNGTSSERIELFIYNGNISISVRDNNVQQVNMITNISASGNNKIAFAYKLNDFALYINGSQIALDNNGTIPSINKYNSYGRYDGATGDMSNLLKSSSLYNTRLSNSELQALTT